MITIKTGQYAISQSTMSTILGSCVSICLYEPSLQLGAMCHYLLSKPLSKDFLDEQNYGSFLLETMWQQFISTPKCNIKNIQASIFGGGEILNNITMKIGQKNVTFGMEWLNEKNLYISKIQVGKNVSRNIKFNPLTGKILIKENLITIL